MQLWLSSSAGFNVVSSSTVIADASNFQTNAYRAVLGSIQAGYSRVIPRYTGATFVAFNGFTINEYNLPTDLSPANSFLISGGDRTYKKYEYYGRANTPGRDEFADSSEVSLGDFWVLSTDDADSYTNITLYSDITGTATSVPGTVNVDMAFRQTVNINSGQITPNDKVVFRFFLNSGNTSITASLKENGVLKVVPTNNSILTNNIEICVDQTNNTFYLDSGLSEYFGPAYLFNPLDSSVSASYSSLFSVYGDTLYPFSLVANDKIVVQAINESGPILEYTVDSVFVGGGNIAYIRVKEDIDGYFNACGKFYKILFLKRVIDETSIIIELPKPPGKTSYGFSIPQNIDPAVLANIDVITRNVNSQLVDVGIGVIT